MWELPAVQTGEQDLSALGKLFSAKMKTAVHLNGAAGDFAHRITHHQFNVRVVEGRARAALPQTRTRVWTTAQKLAQFPVSSMVNKALALTGRI